MKKLILGLMLAALGANAELVDINGAKVERNTPYDIVDGESGTVGEFLDVGGFAMQTNVYDKSETDAKIDEKVSSLDFYKKSEVDAKIADEGVKRQDGDTAAINSAKTYIDDKLKTYEASPNYAAVSNAAMTALQPAATNGLVTASVTNGLASAAALSAHASDTNNPHVVTAASLGARDLLDLAVYEVATNAQTGAVSANKTADTLVKKSEVGGIVAAREYFDLWDLDNGETIRLYFKWNEDTEQWLFSNIEDWSGHDAPPSYPVYYARVSDTNITSMTLTYYEKTYEDAPTYFQATRRLESPLGLAFVGDNVSEFANNAGYAKTNELSGAFDTFFNAKLGYGTDSEAIYPNVVRASDVSASGSLGVPSWDQVYVWQDESDTLQSRLDERAKRYALVASASASIGAADGCLYALTADTNGVSVTLPTALAGYAQDFVIRLVAADTNGTHFAAISNLTANVDFPMGDVREEFSLKGTNYVTFTQTTKDTWSIGYFAANKEE